MSTTLTAAAMPQKETTSTNEIKAGDVLAERDLTNIQGEPVHIPDPERAVHLQFRRYAGCPVWNLHLRSIAVRHDELITAGIREVVVFHSSAETMLPHQGELPFAAIADPDKKLYGGEDVSASGLEPAHLEGGRPRFDAGAQPQGSDGQGGGAHGSPS